MELIFRICLFIAGVINLLPCILAFIPQKISSSYGISIPNQNYELLLRHRAVLFGIIGGLMVFSAISQLYYSMAVLVGMISMVSFVILYLLIKEEINPELQKVMKIDVVGITILLMGYILFRFF